MKIQCIMLITFQIHIGLHDRRDEAKLTYMYIYDHGHHSILCKWSELPANVIKCFLHPLPPRNCASYSRPQIGIYTFCVHRLIREYLAVPFSERDKVDDELITEVTISSVQDKLS